LKYEVVATPRIPASARRLVAGGQLDGETEPGDLQLEIGDQEDHAEQRGQAPEEP